MVSLDATAEAAAFVAVEVETIMDMLGVLMVRESCWSADDCR